MHKIADIAYSVTSWEGIRFLNVLNLQSTDWSGFLGAWTFLKLFYTSHGNGTRCMLFTPPRTKVQSQFVSLSEQLGTGHYWEEWEGYRVLWQRWKDLCTPPKACAKNSAPLTSVVTGTLPLPLIPGILHPFHHCSHELWTLYPSHIQQKKHLDWN